MARRIIDISVALKSGIASDPPGNEPKIEYIDHKMSAEAVCAYFPGMTYFKDGLATIHNTSFLKKSPFAEAYDMVKAVRLETGMPFAQAAV